jgi:hypothetical protein
MKTYVHKLTGDTYFKLENKNKELKKLKYFAAMKDFEVFGYTSLANDEDEANNSFTIRYKGKDLDSVKKVANAEKEVLEKYAKWGRI